ncbi:MAG: hypothetical protein WAM60_11985 [Candidatus Promineifilaceae bacterium]
MFSIEPIGFVRSKITRREDAPRQGDEGGPEAIDRTPIVDIKPVLSGSNPADR